MLGQHLLDLVGLPRVVSKEARERHEKGPQGIAVPGVAHRPVATGKDDLLHRRVAMCQGLGSIADRTQGRVAYIVHALSQQRHSGDCCLQGLFAICQALRQRRGHVISGHETALQSLEQRCQPHANVDDVAPHLFDRQDQPPVGLPPQRQLGLESVIDRCQAQHGKDRIGGLKVVQELVPTFRCIVGLHPVPVPAVDGTPVTARMAVSRRRQHALGSQVGKAISHLCGVARGQGPLLLPVRAGVVQFDDRAPRPA